MARSVKKGPYIDQHLLDQLQGKQHGDRQVIKTWSRRATITPEMVGFTFGVHNGKEFIEVLISEEMVGHKLGEFSPTTKFARHGGKMQKEIEQKSFPGAGPAPAEKPAAKK